MQKWVKTSENFDIVPYCDFQNVQNLQTALKFADHYAN